MKYKNESFYQWHIQEYIYCHIICNGDKLKTTKCPSAMNGQVGVGYLHNEQPTTMFNTLNVAQYRRIHSAWSHL